MVYKGGWLNDKKHGQGVLIDPNGDVFKGVFKDGIKYGQNNADIRNDGMPGEGTHAFIPHAGNGRDVTHPGSFLQHDNASYGGWAAAMKPSYGQDGRGFENKLINMERYEQRPVVDHVVDREGWQQGGTGCYQTYPTPTNQGGFQSRELYGECHLTYRVQDVRVGGGGWLTHAAGPEQPYLSRDKEAQVPVPYGGDGLGTAYSYSPGDGQMPSGHEQVNAGGWCMDASSQSRGYLP